MVLTKKRKTASNKDVTKTRKISNADPMLSLHCTKVNDRQMLDWPEYWQTTRMNTQKPVICCSVM